MSDAATDVRTCKASYDPLPEKATPGDIQRTHICYLSPGHPGLHHCPTCGSQWVERKES